MVDERIDDPAKTESRVRFCRRLMGDAASAEDLAQETLLRAQASIARLGEPYRFGPWLLGIAANLARKWWRVQARAPLSLDSLASAYPNVAWDESLAAAVASPEELEELAEQRQLLRDAVAALPPALSRAVVLHYLHGLGYAVSDIVKRDYGQSEFFLKDDDGVEHCFGVATETPAAGE